MNTLALATVHTFLDGVHHLDALTLLNSLPANSVHCVITSPPYYGLRDYSANGQIGLEDTPDRYVARLVEVFEGVRRVLRDDGVCWLNLGDTYAGGGRGGNPADSAFRKQATNVGSLVPRSTVPNLLNCLYTSIEKGVLFIGSGCTLTVTAHSDNVLETDQITPDSEFTRLFGLKRITIKKGNDSFSQVINLLNAEADACLSPSVCFRMVNKSSLEIITDEFDNLNIVCSDLDLDSQAPFGVTIGTNAGKSANVSLPVKKASEPVTETITDIQPVRDAITINASGEGVLNVNAVDKAVSLSDGFVFRAGSLRNFGITEASEKHLAFAMFNGRVNLAFRSVAHLFISNEYGSLMRYAELYRKAERKANTLRPKQELGIPEMVKRALMEAGWYCRSTIIWAKPNPMPESVTDRPTKAHEYVFLLTKSARYFYDADAIRENPSQSTIDRWGTDCPMRKNTSPQGIEVGPVSGESTAGVHPNGRNRRTVWTIPTEPRSFPHFAMFPQALIEPMILAGCPVGGIVLDPFMGSGTTALVAQKHGRHFIGCDVNDDYVSLARDRVRYHGDDKRMVAEQAAGVEQLDMFVA